MPMISGRPTVHGGHPSCYRFRSMKQGLEEIPAWGWLAFAVLVIVLLAVDHIAHRGDRAGSQRIAVIWSIIWVGAGLAFNLFVWIVFGAQPAKEYLATYVIEKALSTDNMFLFYVIFQSLNIPKQEQHKALFWGIVGAVVFRGIFIFLGTEALRKWEWITYVFGAIILYAAYRAFRQDPESEKENKLVGWLARRLPITEENRGGQFVAREDGRMKATPLLLALLAIEFSDIMFAVDSVAVAFSMTRNAFVLYTSNVFAILGLRALYLLLAHIITKLHYLHYGLAAVLAFAGIKLLADPIIHIPHLVSVAIVGVVIAVSVWLSLREPGALANARTKT